ncbi:MAG: DUF1801 domain-containing protein [Ferruginibacter sp.]
MAHEHKIGIRSILHLFEVIPENEKIIVDVLRQIVLETLPSYCKEKISFNVPYFYGNRGICIIWPAAIPRGGIRSGVLFGLWYGNKLNDTAKYLVHGTNKQIFYKIFHSPEEINVNAVKKILLDAVRVDQLHSLKKANN